ncbi:hypothetical protein BCR35DRAFT_330098 [Leucosporidium creatinivorum]|uniref:Uncharacterized protein n=1 Tax=Leucosporidium creatinivorum TaxID=106004 RepID=A0A1Y2FW70_9BASI|nr:hypothetical protein BCR35DRAFT_330098 [Leucosporidium creatinivorum]
MPKQRQHQQPKRTYQEIAHDRVLCAAVHFTSANPNGLNSFGAVGGLAVAAILGRYEFKPRAALIPVARPDIDVDIEAHYSLDVIVDNLQAKGQGPSFIPAGKLLSSRSKTYFSGSFYRIGKVNPKGPKVEDKTVFWWGKRAPAGTTGDVKIDMHKGTKMQKFMPAHANPFRATKLVTVHLRPKIPIGEVRIFQAPLILLRKLFMDRTDGTKTKAFQDFLDVERLLVAEKAGHQMGLDALNMKGWFDRMPVETFKKLEKKVEGWRTRDSQAHWMNDWEFEQLKFADSVSEEKKKEIKSLTGQKSTPSPNPPFHVYSRHDQAERLAALAESDDSVPTLRRSKRVKVFKSGV